MRALFSLTAVVTAILFTSSPLWARTCYLSNGDELECKSVWKKEGRVYILINRDTLVDFAPDEVDLARTAKSAAKEKKAHHGKQLKFKKRKAVHKQVTATPAPAATKRVDGNSTAIPNASASTQGTQPVQK